MTASTQIKGVLAGVAAFALIGAAMAQGSPPNPAVKNAPTGAGQQSSQGTPMGTTGTPAGGGTTSTAPANSAATGGSASSGSTSSMGGTSSGTSMGSTSGSTDTAMSSGTSSGSRAKRRVRADRN